MQWKNTYMHNIMDTWIISIKSMRIETGKFCLELTVQNPAQVTSAQFRQTIL